MILFLNVHARIGVKLLPCASHDRLELRLSPTIVHTSGIPDFRWRRHLFKIYVDGEPAVRAIEANWLPICWTFLVGIDVHMKEPLDIMIYRHVPLLRHITMAFAFSKLEVSILDTNLHTSQ